MQILLFKFNPLFPVLNFQLIYQYSKQHDTTFEISQPLNLKDESFHNSIEWSGLYLQVNIPPWLGNFFQIYSVQITEKCIL